MEYKIEITKSGVDGYDVHVVIDTHQDTSEGIREFIDNMNEFDRKSKFDINDILTNGIFIKD